MPEIMNSETRSNAAPTTSASKNILNSQNEVVTDSQLPLSNENQILLEKMYATRLPWGVIREKLPPVASTTSNSALNINTTTTQSNDASVSLEGFSQHQHLLIKNDFSNIEKKRPGEYLMNLLMFNFVQLGSKKLEQIVSGDKRDKRLKDCFQKNEDQHLDKIVLTMGSVAEQSLPSLTRSLLIWHELQLTNLSYLKQQQQHSDFNAFSLTANSKIALKSKQLLNQAKIENEILDERKELVIHSLLCIALVEILKQLPFHPGNDDLLSHIIDLSFKRFLSKDVASSLNQSNQLLISDNQYVTDLYAEVIGTIAQSRFSLVKRRFLNEFEKLKVFVSPASNQLPMQSNVSLNPPNSSTSSSLVTTPVQNTHLSLSTSPSTIVSQNSFHSTPNSVGIDQSTTALSSIQPTGSSQQSLLSQSNLNINSNTLNNIQQIKLFTGMKYFRIKMVPIEDFEASFHFLNFCAQYFVDTKDRDIKHTLAGLFVEILVPIIGSVKNEVNIPCLKTFVEILYPHAMELSAKSKHRLATFPLLTCLLCVSQKNFFLNNWFQFAQLCLQQFKGKDQSITRSSLESILRLVWVYMIRIKGEKSSETNQRLQTILQCLFPKSQKIVIPKEMPSNIFIKIIQYIAYEKLDFAMKEIVYELLSIDVNSSYTSNVETSNNNNSNENEQFNINGNNMNNGMSDSQTHPLNSSNLNTQNAFINNNLSSNAFKTSKENLLIHPLRMEIGLRAFIQIADTLQFQRENGISPPSMPSTFNTFQNNENLSIYLSNTTNTGKQNQIRPSILTDSLAREIGLSNYFEHIRRSFQDILKTLDCTIGKTFLMTRPDNTQSTNEGLVVAGGSITNDNTNINNINNNNNNIVSNSNSNNLNSSQTTMSSVTSNVASAATNLLTTAQSTTASVVATSADVFTSSSLHNFNLHHTNSVGSNNSSGSTNMGKSMNNDLSEHTNIQITNNLMQIQNKDNIFNLENKSKLWLMKICISLIPRMMPLFKESELVEILTRLTIHLDDELKMIAFQTLKTFVSEFSQWRKYVFIGFTNFILKEISDMYPKLIENALKMLIQLLNTWKYMLIKTKASTQKQNNDDYCQIIFHLEGFSLFNLCHSQIQRRRYALIILRECKSIGELVKCFRFYPYHNYAIDILDLASIHAMKQLHLQCFNSGLLLTNTKPDLAYLIEQSANWENSIINTSTYNNNDNLNNSNSSTNASNSTINQSQNVSNNTNTSTNTTPFFNIINKSTRTSSVSNQTTNNNDLNSEGNEIVNNGPINNNSNNLNNLNQTDSESQSQACNNNQNTSGNVLNQNLQSSSILSQTNNYNHSNSASIMFTFDPWTECLAIFFSYDFIFTKCPQARIDAWPFIYTRLQQILPFVDPNEQPHETSRTSILFGVGANSLEKIRKAANERDANLNLWKNYLLGACCLAYGSDRYLYYNEYEKALMKTDEKSENQSITNNWNLVNNQSNINMVNNCQSATSMSVDFTMVESASKFYATFGTSTSLIKLIVPFLNKCECNYFREIVIRGLGRINIEAVRDLVDELNPIIKDCLLDKRQEKLRRMKKKDLTRLAIVRIFELMAEQRTLGKRIIDTTKKSPYLKNMHAQLVQQYTNEEQQFKKSFNDYVDGMHSYFDQELDKNSDLSGQIRLHFANFLYKLIDTVSKDKRSILFSSTTRVNLFFLCDKWSGRFSLMQNGAINNTSSQQQSNNQPSSSGLLSLRFINNNPNQSSSTNTANSNSNIQTQRTSSNQFYVHHNHYHHHKCYHFYEELELAATKACAEILCCGDTYEKLSFSSSPNSTLTNSASSNISNRSSIVFTWLSQLLENANIEMKIYDSCKCILSNEIYMLALNVCIQLLDLSLNKNATNTSRNNYILEWIIQKCYSSLSQEIADLCFIALARVYIKYSNENLICINKNKINNNNLKNQPSSPTNVPQQSLDSVYLNPILTLAILNIGSSRLNIHETSICLLRLINKCHLQDNYIVLNENENSIPSKSPISANKDDLITNSSKLFANLDAPLIEKTEVNNSKNSNLSTSSAPSPKQTKDSINWNNPSSFLNIDFDIINSMVIYSKSQLFISEYLARKNPEQTMFTFCEITSRFETCASHQVRRTMLNILVPWFYNLELVDPNVVATSSKTFNEATTNLSSNGTGLGFLPLQTGYGSIEGTQIILNNLFYLTCKFGEEYSTEFELLWAVLVSTWKSNLKIACRFLFIMVSLASYEMLENVKRVICYISKTCPERLVDELIIELECMDSLVSILDKCENILPFYRYNRPVPVPPSPIALQTQTEKKGQKSTKSRTYFVNREEGDEDEENENNTDSNAFFNNDDISDDYDSSDEDDDDDDDDDEDDYINDNDADSSCSDHVWADRFKSVADQSDDCQSDSDDEEDDETKDNNLCRKNVQCDSDQEFKKKKSNKPKKNPINQQQNNSDSGVKQNKSSAFKSPNHRLLIETSALPNPTNFQSYICPLNILLFHIGHNHRHQHSHHHYPTVHSYHYNYYHHNHYHHLTQLSRGGIALMLLSELMSTDGADFDWTSYLPLLFHFCLINFDSTKPLIGEHAKKLFLNILYILTVQNELYTLTDFLIESIESIIDNQSIIFDRKYTNNNSIENSSIIFNTSIYNHGSIRLTPGNCHYNYNFNTIISSSNLKGFSNNQKISMLNTSSHRALINMHSAPSSPANQNNKNNSNNSNHVVESILSPQNDPLTINDSPKKTGKRSNKIHKAKEHLAVLLNILSRCKNSPVWPYELITCQNYSKELTSVHIINEFVSNLQSFLQLCFSTKQVSTISSCSTRSFSSPLNLTQFSLNEKNLNNIDKKWSHFALSSSLITTSRHYAGRSLQIYRALGIKFNSFSTMVSLVNRLMDTVADSNEDVQGYVTEMLLTMKMNANLFAFQYLKSLNEQSTTSLSSSSKDTAIGTSNVLKQKSKSLKQDQQQKKIIDEQKKKSATTIIPPENVKLKTATLSRKLVEEIDNQPSRKLKESYHKTSKSNTKYKHQIAYKKSLTLSLFNLKWQILEDRIDRSALNNNKSTMNYQSNLNLIAEKNKILPKKLNNSSNKNGENLRTLVKMFWTCICLLESDFDHEFVLAIEIIEQILGKIDLNNGVAGNGQLLVHKNEFRTQLELFSFKINWPDFPGLQNLLLKGCTSSNENTTEATHRLLVQLIPYCSKLNFVEPYAMSYYGLWGISMNLLALLPTMIYNYENPNELCIQAAELYCKILKDQIKMLEEQPRPPPPPQQQSSVKSSNSITKSNKIEQLKCLVHVMNLYSTNSFGKDRSQWTKCVITYLSEFFQFCQNEQTNSSSFGDVIDDQQTISKSNNFYFNWIVFLTELLDKHTNNSKYQSCVLLCLNSLLNFISFNDQTTWSFINEELMRIIVKYVNSSLWSEALDLIKLTVSKSSSLTDLNKSTRLSSNSNDLGINLSSSQVPVLSQNFFGKKELPGRTLDFDFDFSLFIPSEDQQNLKLNSPTQQSLAQTVNSNNKKQQIQQQQPQQMPPLYLMNFYSNKQFQYINQHLIGLGTHNTMTGWKYPQLSQNKTRQKIFLLLNTLNKNQAPNSILDQGGNNNKVGSLNSNSTSTSSIQKSSSLLFENNSLNSSAPHQTQLESNEHLNSTTNNTNTNNNSANNATNSINENSRASVSIKIITSPIKNSSSTNNSSPAITNSSNGISNNSSSNSLSQTSYLTSPAESKNTALLSPREPVNSNLPVNSSFGMLTVKHHSRQNSTTSFGKMKIAPQANMTATKSVEMSNKQHGRNPSVQSSNIDDNNFINNTFSFLDDLDNGNEFDLNIIENLKQQQKQQNTIKGPEHGNENFPWNAIYPAGDSRQDLNSPSLTDSVQSNIDKISMQNDHEKSKTLPNKFFLNSNAKLSSSFTASSTFKNSNQDSSFESDDKKLFYNISSKSKPVAPKMSATIGVASGAEALKTMNSFNMNSNSNENSSTSFSTIKDNIFKINSNNDRNDSNLKKNIDSNSSKEPQQMQQNLNQALNGQNERRPSITRIIRSDSFQNVKPIAPIASPRQISNSVTSPPSSFTSNTSSISSLSNNIIYDHQPDKIDKSQIKTTPIKKTESNTNLFKNNTLADSSENIFQAKRNALKGSSVNNLSNLLAQDDKKLIVNNLENLLPQSDKSHVIIKNSNNSIKSLTLPGKSSHISPHSSSNVSTHLSVRNVNFQLPNKTLSSSSIGSLNKSNSASDSSIQEKSNELIKKNQSLFVSCLPFINLLNVNGKDIEETWKAHVVSVFDKKNMNKSLSSPSINLIETFFLFKKLFKETRRSLNILIGESCENILINTKIFSSVNRNFVNIMNLINKKLTCPLVYFDQSLLMLNNSLETESSATISSTDLRLAAAHSIVDKHRKTVWEIGENVDTFVDLRKKAFEILEKIKKAEASEATGNRTILIDSQKKLERKKDLCKRLSKLLSQFMLILQSFSKLLPNVTKSLSSTKVFDQSQEFTELYKNLSESSKKYVENNRLSPIAPLNKNQLTAISVHSQAFAPNSKELFVHLILEAIRKENCDIAVECYKMAQTYWPTEFTKTNSHSDTELDIDFIFFLACENNRLKNSNMMAIVSEEETFNETIQTILLENIEITNQINFIEKKIRENSTGTYTDEEVEC